MADQLLIYLSRMPYILVIMTGLRWELRTHAFETRDWKVGTAILSVVVAMDGLVAGGSVAVLGAGLELGLALGNGESDRMRERWF